jgi:hypothetical protein
MLYSIAHDIEAPRLPPDKLDRVETNNVFFTG